jgi:hypothetical protein
LQAFIDAVEGGKAFVPIDKVFKMDEIAKAHAYMVSSVMLTSMPYIVEPKYADTVNTHWSFRRVARRLASL